MKYVEAPEGYTGQEPSLFLAGGITGCPDWQAEVVEKLEEGVQSQFSNDVLRRLVVLNPRRKTFNITDPLAAQDQITWEYNHLHHATLVLFWFPKETLCPIVLYELGAYGSLKSNIFVGTHPEYARRQDVEIQLALARPEIDVVDSLEDLVKQVLVKGAVLWPRN